MKLGFFFLILGWWQYDERTSQEIEEAYKKEEKFCTILVAGYVYVVDFETMLQQRQNDPSRKRQVKRDLATTPKKGVAGLRIDGTTENSPEISIASSSATASNYQSPQTLNSVTNNVISTIAATDAAIRIASDIIDSTLAHADEYRNQQSATSSHDQSSDTQSRQQLLDEVEETLNISNSSCVPSTSPNLDFFSSTIDEFRSLALSNIAESSSDSEHDDDDDKVTENSITGGHHVL